MKGTRDAGYAIVERKGSTYYAIGVAVLTVVEAILRDQRTVLTVCAPMQGQFGVAGMALSLPTVVGHSGAEEILDIPMDQDEVALFQKSAQLLRSRLAETLSRC